MTEQSLDFSLLAPERQPTLSANLFADPAFTQTFGEIPSATVATDAPDQLVLDSPFANAANPENAKLPLLDPLFAEQIGKADGIEFTTAQENADSKAVPDYRVVVGDDGKLQLQKVGEGDPLADGKLNIELDAKANESLAEAIKNADKNLKEFIREMMDYWRQNHPGKAFPGWWTDILNGQPNIPSDAQPVPIRPAQPAAAKPSDAPPPSTVTQQPVPQQPGGSQPPSGGGSGGGGSRGGGGGASGGGGGSSGGGGSFGGAGAGGGDGRGYGYDTGGRYRGGDTGGDTTYNGAKPSSEKQAVLDNVKIVVDVAKQVGVDPKLAVAMMLVESGGDNKAVGDNGTSFGLFQLHDGGMLTSAGLTSQQAFDPRTNAEVSLGALAKVVERMGNTGEAAAASQRPADPVGYAAKVNASLDEAAELIAMSENATGSATASGADVRKADGYAFPLANYSKDNVQLHWGSNQGGSDIFADRGTPILAVGAGTITSAGYSELGGYNVSMKLDNGLEAYYAHLDKPPIVQAGQKVEAGQQLGVVGDSGNAQGKGTMLHFGLGTEIINGSGPTGGMGANFNAVGLLNNVLKNSNNA